MGWSKAVPARSYRAYTRKDLDGMPRLARLGKEWLDGMKAVSAVLPFRVNNYVLEDLIDWSDIPDDPIFQLTFGQPEMLAPVDFERMLGLVRREAPADEIKCEARRVQDSLNPHPAGQMQLNVPRLWGTPIPGMQHKYRETVLFFPSQGQTCHAYCTYCFRWAQFVGIEELKFASHEAETLVAYLRAHPEVTSVLFTGGDPMIMRTRTLRRYIEPLLHPALSHLASIRIGTKALGYWPYRFLDGEEADDLLKLFEEVVAAGRNLAFMAHFSHPRELGTPVVAAAIRRVLGAGATIRCQAPLVRHVNDAAEVWADMWRHQVRLGMIPYYMFVERNTGPKNYFEVPLARATRIFQKAYRQVSGLARTVRGPSMSAAPGKVCIDGVTEIHGERVFALRFIQGRDPRWVGRPFYARHDAGASWLTELRPAFGDRRFFYEAEFDRIRSERESRWPLAAGPAVPSGELRTGRMPAEALDDPLPVS